jgi:hypothetical protein
MVRMAVGVDDKANRKVLLPYQVEEGILIAAGVDNDRFATLFAGQYIAEYPVDSDLQLFYDHFSFI